MTTVNFNTIFDVEVCFDDRCGIQWAMERKYRNRLIETKRTFWCPNGHKQHYMGQTEAAKARKEAKVRDWLWKKWKVKA